MAGSRRRAAARPDGSTTMPRRATPPGTALPRAAGHSPRNIPQGERGEVSLDQKKTAGSPSRCKQRLDPFSRIARKVNKSTTARRTSSSRRTSRRTAGGSPTRRKTRSQHGNGDRKSTRLNYSHGYNSYAVFLLN